MRLEFSRKAPTMVLFPSTVFLVRSAGSGSACVWVLQAVSRAEWTGGGRENGRLCQERAQKPTGCLKVRILRSLIFCPEEGKKILQTNNSKKERRKKKLERGAGGLSGECERRSPQEQSSYAANRSVFTQQAPSRSPAGRWIKSRPGRSR